MEILRIFLAGVMQRAGRTGRSTGPAGRVETYRSRPRRGRRPAPNGTDRRRCSQQSPTQTRSRRGCAEGGIPAQSRRLLPLARRCLRPCACTPAAAVGGVFRRSKMAISLSAVCMRPRRRVSHPRAPGLGSFARFPRSALHRLAAILAGLGSFSRFAGPSGARIGFVRAISTLARASLPGRSVGNVTSWFTACCSPGTQAMKDSRMEHPRADGPDQARSPGVPTTELSKSTEWMH
jgi:hypothetical protein